MDMMKALTPIVIAHDQFGLMASSLWKHRVLIVVTGFSVITSVGLTLTALLSLYGWRLNAFYTTGWYREMSGDEQTQVDRFVHENFQVAILGLIGTNLVWMILAVWMLNLVRRQSGKG